MCSYELNVFKDTWRQTAEKQNGRHSLDTEGRDKQAQVWPLAVESGSPVTPAPHFTKGSMCTVHSVTSPNTKGTAEHTQQMMDICYHCPLAGILLSPEQEQDSDMKEWRNLEERVLSETQMQGHTVWAPGRICPQWLNPDRK